jgi:[histone H3]-lysine4 N-trimethyltransferase MLL3
LNTYCIATLGMVGLQRPQGEPGLKPEDLEEDNKMICLANTDEFVLKQDICVMCGSLGNDLEGRLICCAQCGQCYHPQCVNVKVGLEQTL